MPEPVALDGQGQSELELGTVAEGDDEDEDEESDSGRPTRRPSLPDYSDTESGSESDSKSDQERAADAAAPDSDSESEMSDSETRGREQALSKIANLLAVPNPVSPGDHDQPQPPLQSHPQLQPRRTIGEEESRLVVAAALLAQKALAFAQRTGTGTGTEKGTINEGGATPVDGKGGSAAPVQFRIQTSDVEASLDIADSLPGDTEPFAALIEACGAAQGNDGT